jgi:hypothetical protein
MRRGALAAVIGSLLALLLAPAAVASHDPSGAPFGEDFAGGDASFRGGIQIDVDAHSGPSGENPTGNASISLRANFIGGPVTCLTVTGNRAVVGGEFAGFGYLFVLVDNAATGTPDRFGSGDPGQDSPTSCPANPAVALDPIESGDLVVHDARPFPTSKDQCKNGGWRNFGTRFKNQGQCIAFVERHPQP